MAGSSEELRAAVEEYARSIGAPLIADRANFGLEAAVQRVAADPKLIAPVVVTWAVAEEGVRVVPLRPAPRYPWYGVWRTASAHPSLRPVLAPCARRATIGRPRDIRDVGRDAATLTPNGERSVHAAAKCLVLFNAARLDRSFGAANARLCAHRQAAAGDDRDLTRHHQLNGPGVC